MMTIFTQRITVLFAFICLISCTDSIQVDSIEKEFQNPPDWAKPHTWWHWVDGHVSKEGISKDMEAWKALGIGGFQQFDISWGIPDGGTEFNSPDYHDKMRHAFNEAERLGLEAGINSASGWSSTGGPWVTPEHSMKMIVWSETAIKGGAEKSVALDFPDLDNLKRHGNQYKGHRNLKQHDFYRDVAVIAFPTPANKEYRLEKWEEKSLQALYTRPDNFFATNERTPRNAVIAAADIRNITDKMDNNGVLTWDAPDGNWTILRLGYSTTGAFIRPGSKAGQGLEIDKMSRAAVDVHWDELIEKIIADADGKKALTTILIDSYEVGHQNWTDDFPKQFTNLCRYDIIPNLVCMTGRIVESTEYTERVLWDMRKTVADLMHKNYFQYFKEKCHEQGFKLATEPYGTGSFDAPTVAKISDLALTEFWMRETPFSRRNLWDWTSQIVPSAVRLKGEKIVSAESFTRMQGDWTAHPYSMKIRGDRAFAAGVNRYYFHTSVHQPWNDNVKPGFTMGQFGTQFHRNNTWFYKSKEWLKYIARCQYVMQKGRYVSDLLVLYGESQGAISFIGQEEQPLKDYLSGLRFDLSNIETLNTLSVDETGSIRVTYNGTLLENKYKLLLIERADLMTVETAEKMANLVEQGATIFAPKPLRTPGLSDFKGNDKKLQQLVAKYWDSGKIKAPEQFNSALSTIQNDCEIPEQTEYSHHIIDGNDYYFVANQSYEERVLNCKFRVAGKLPEIWNPETGEIAPAENWKITADGRTEVALNMSEAASVFVVFREETNKDRNSTPKPRFEELALINTPWQVEFDKHYVPKGQITLDSLIPLNEHADFNVRHFSGTATYKTIFQVEKTGKPMFIDLGDVQVIAEIKLNGKVLKTLWKPPFRIDISDIVKSGENELEVKVTNLWVNRLIGDEHFPAWEGRVNGDKEKRGRNYNSFPEWLRNGASIPEDDKKAFSAWCHWTKDDELLNSGLIGPVKILSADAE